MARVLHCSEIPAADSTLAPGATTIRRIISEGDDALVVFRIVELEPGKSTPFHAHWWEHGLYILSGSGAIRTSDAEHPVAEGSTVFVAGNEMHQFVNTGSEVMRYLCVVPNPKLEHVQLPVS